MIHHFRWIPGTPEWLKWIGLRGYIGVDLFFVLSGWLIGGQLLRELRKTGGLAVGRFWTKRWLRTLPAYYAVLLIIYYFDVASSDDLPILALFLQNYLAPAAWLVTWSLCIEEHFYLSLPLVTLGLRRFSRASLWAMAGVAILASPLLRWLGWADMRAGSYVDFLGQFYSPTHLRLEGLVFGVALAALAQYETAVWDRLRRLAVPLAVLGIALVVGTTWNPFLTGWTSDGQERMAFFPAVAGFLTVSAGTALMLPFASQPVARMAFGWRPFVWMAEHAYTLYLCHEFVPRIASRFSDSFWGVSLITWSSAFVGAWLLRRTIEVPGLRLRGRVIGRWRGTGARQGDVASISRVESQPGRSSATASRRRS